MGASQNDEGMTETTRNDFEGGRQLAWVVAIGTVLVSGLTGVLLYTEEAIDSEMINAMITISVGGVALTIFAFARPVIAIRLVMGRWGELAKPIAKEIPSPSNEDLSESEAKVAEAAQRALESHAEGAPIEVAAAEQAFGDKKRRARLGIAAMVGSFCLIGLAALFTYFRVIPEPLIEPILGGCITLGVGGLILWYRTQ